MRRRLRALVDGRVDEAGDPSVLFSVALDDPAAVGKRVDALRVEVRQARGTVEGLQARLRDLDRDFPPPERPAVLDEPLDEPVPPTPPAAAPSPPERPTALDVTLPPEPPAPEPPTQPRPTAVPEGGTAPSTDVAPGAAPPTGGPAPATDAADAASSPAEPADTTETTRPAPADAGASLDVADPADAGAETPADAPAADATAADATAADATAAWEAYDAAHAAWEPAHRAWEEARDAREQVAEAFAAAEARHAEAIAAHDAAMTAHEAAVAEYDGAVKARDEEQERRAALEAAWEAAVAAHGVEQTLRRTALEAETTAARARQETSAARLTYLLDVQRMLEALPDPAIATVARLRSSRPALRRYADVLEAVAGSLDTLRSRVTRLANRTAVGGVLGFRVEREELEQQLRGSLEAIAGRTAECRKLAQDVIAAAEGFETEGRALHRQIFATLRAPERTATLDALFTERLERLRRLRRTRPETAVAEVTDADVGTLQAGLAAVLAHPDSIGSTGEGDNEALAVLGQLAEVDGLLTAVRHAVERWDLLVARETVSILESLASDETRSRAYSLSEELLEDLQAEISVLWERLGAWGGSWADRIVALPATLANADGRWAALRVLLSIALGLLLLPLSVRVPRLVSWLVRHVVRRSFARGRVGAIVRVAGLVQALLPTVLLAAVAYGILALLGFDNVEVAFAEVAVRWWLFYRAGRKLLEGLTQRITPGRPALVSMTPETAKLLSLTYARGGLVLAVAAIVSELGRRFLGLGVLHTLLAMIFWLWLIAVWGIWATLAWRKTAAAAWLAVATPGGRAARVARFVLAHGIGAPLVPVAVLLVGAQRAIALVRRLTLERGLTAYLRARTLKRMSRKTTEEGDGALPERYAQEFPLYPILGDEEALLLPRDAHVDSILEQFRAWRRTRADGSLTLVGEKGVGKTTLLAMLERRIHEEGGDTLRVEKVVLQRKLVTPEALARELSIRLVGEETGDLDELAATLRDGPERVVLIDETHNVFLRVVDGFRAINALGRLMNATSSRVFWIATFNGFAWSFIAESRRQARAFRRRAHAPAWTIAELRELIARRNQRSGFAVEFDEALLDTPTAGGTGFALLEGADGYFRLLWEASGGNPRVATWLWLRSLRLVGENRLRVGVFRTTRPEVLLALDPELLFALAAICQHENLTVEELSRVLNVAPDFAEFALRFLVEAGYVEAKTYDATRFTLSPAFYPQVVSALQTRNLLFGQR